MEVLSLVSISFQILITVANGMSSYCGLLAFELFFIYMYLWETKGRTLEQTAALFDEDGTEDTREYRSERQYAHHDLTLSVVHEIGAEGYRHRSLVSDSSHQQLRFSPRAEKYQGEHFEMAPQTRHPTYDWDKVYEDRARRDSYTTPPKRAASKRVTAPQYY